MLLHSFFTPGLAVNSYIIADEISKKAAVIDPTRAIGSYLNYAAKEKLTITDILETHVHADFASGALELKRSLEGKPIIHCSAMGGKEWSPLYADHLIKDKEDVSIGSLRLQALHTPGHTPEHLIWLVFDTQRSNEIPVMAFTGDLILVGSVGRPDLLGKESEGLLTKQLYNTLFDRIPLLPDDMKVFPGHGAGSSCGKEIGRELSSTMGQQRQFNPWLKKKDFEKWKKSLLDNMPAVPKYFKLMKKMNITGSGNQVPNGYVILKAAQALELMPQCVIVDARSSELFSELHLKGSINIPPSPNAAFWAGAALSGDEQILLVVSSIDDAPALIESLKLIGIDAVKGIIIASAWKDGNEKVFWESFLESTPNMDVKTLEAQQGRVYILDVRMPAEWDAGHIAEAHLMELSKLRDSLEFIPRDKPIAVICHSGKRSSLAASMLRKAGFSSVSSVEGGMQAWQKAKAQ